MPREFPRHEIKAERKKEVVASFSKNEKELGSRSNPIHNPTRWSGVHKIELTPAVGRAELDRRQQELTAHMTRLKKLADFQRVGNRPAKWAEPWKERAKNARGDLPGLWNDFKQQMSARAAFSGDPLLTRTVDWLSLAEESGGINTRLEQWRDVLNGDWNYVDLAPCAEEIAKGIEFCRETVKEGFGDPGGLSEQQGKNRDELLFALDSIASEVIRQGELSLTGKRFGVGEPFDAMKVRLTELSARASAEAVARESISGMQPELGRTQLDQILGKMMPDAVLQDAVKQGTARDLTEALSAWQDSVADLKASGRLDEADDHVTLATAVADAAATLAGRLQESAALATIDRGFTADQVSLALNAYRTITAEVTAFQDRMGASFGEEVREILRRGSSGLGRALRDAEEPRGSVYKSCVDYNTAGRLDAFWSQARAFTDKEVRAKNPGLADLLSQRMGNELENLFADWKTRRPGNEVVHQDLLQSFSTQYPDVVAKLQEGAVVNLNDIDFLRNAVEIENTYLLGWKMTSTIRGLQERAEVTLKDSPKELSFVTTSLDSLAALIGTEVKRVAELTDADVLD